MGAREGLVGWDYYREAEDEKREEDKVKEEEES